jgi:adenine-specific DNA-methyltransferase
MAPPYGIKSQSNFQPGIGNRNVTDGKDDDLTREPEMIQAYRDTWELGIHSYLTYLRDRLQVVRELLTDSGSVFIQIGEENVHLVRVLLDEVFGAENFVSQITFKTTSGAGSSSELKSIPSTCNYLIWYSKDYPSFRYRQLYLPKAEMRSTEAKYSYIELSDHSRRPLTADERTGITELPADSRVYRLDNFTSQSPRQDGQFPIEVDGISVTPKKGYWKTNPEGVEKLLAQRRLVITGNTLSYVRYLDDFLGSPIGNLWEDVSSGAVGDKKYVVQTNPRVIARCILMATDPGDLVLDPTCGSGTTAVVAEQYGRRWITLDTSRVALAIARERLLTSVYPYYELRDPARDVDGGFVYETLDRVTLRSIARGESAERVVLVDQPKIDRRKVRVTGPFTVEALSRYAVNPTDSAPSAVPADQDTSNHVETLLGALRSQGIPRPGKKPAKIESLSPLALAGALQAEGVVDLESRLTRFAVSLGPRFGTITMAQVSDALQQSIGFGLVVFAGFAVSADAQAQLATGKVGGTEVALLLANPDLLVGNLLKNTSSSQTFRLYASPDVNVARESEGYRVTVEGVDSYDASTGEITSFGKTGVQAWFLDDDYDGLVFRVAQAFFPITDGWEKLTKALRGTVDAELIEQLHSWTSLPFELGEHNKVAIRVIANDGNASEVIIPLRLTANASKMRK